jgi:hypothetical protein
MHQHKKNKKMKPSIYCYILKFIIITVLSTFTHFSYAKVISYKVQDPYLPDIDNGSWDKCIIKIDFERRLLSLKDCNFLDTAEGIALFDKEDMLIGKYYYPGEEPIIGGYKYFNMILNLSGFFTVKIKDIHHITLEAPKWRLEEDYIHCKNKNAEIFSDGSTYICYVPYKCSKGEYALNEFDCETLPKHAIRLPEEGFKCRNGFVKSATSDSCLKIPQNSHKVDEFSWECDSGYAQFENNCIKKLTEKSGQ